ncbi:MAG TPA: sugar phosphate isomerase/epimerase [Bryobacteraceae bacterium]|nr:sugar phosphate isomerase/epimerase [Bryobacteraceae bacterium]
MPLDDAIAAMSNIGLSYVELWSGHIEPKPGTSAEEVAKWRTSPDTLEQMKQVRRKFNKAGIRVYALNYSFAKRHTDQEVLHGMEMAKALGAKYITASSTVDQAARINELAKKKNIFVAMHNHSNLKNPNEFATPESFAKAMEGNSNILINFDIGHFTAANFDAVDFLTRNHERIVTLHIKDRKKNQGENTPLGEGDTPIKPVLNFLRANNRNIPAMIEYEYKGANSTEEVRKCFDYCKKILLES